MLVGWRPKYNDAKVASVRFRCLTPLEELRRQNFPVEIYTPEHESQYSLVLFSKLYGAADVALARTLSERGIKTALDLSDNHFYNPFDLPDYKRIGGQLREMIAAVDQVICCSAQLADLLSQEADLRRPALIVGDAVERFDIPEQRPWPFAASADEPFRILWFGSHGSPNAPSGMEDVLRVRPQLDAADRARRSELVIVSNNRSKFESMAPKLNLATRYVEWNELSFAHELARANVVIIPISINPFTVCKSNNRLATALWYGVPAIADPIPAYDELTPFAFVGDWDAGMHRCLTGDDEVRQRTTAGSNYVRGRFNVKEIAAQWRDAMLAVQATS